MVRSASEVWACSVVWSFFVVVVRTARPTPAVVARSCGLNSTAPHAHARALVRTVAFDAEGLTLLHPAEKAKQPHRCPTPVYALLVCV